MHLIFEALNKLFQINVSCRFLFFLRNKKIIKHLQLFVNRVYYHISRGFGVWFRSWRGGGEFSLILGLKFFALLTFAQFGGFAPTNFEFVELDFDVKESLYCSSSYSLIRTMFR